VIALNGTSDHIHLLLRLAATVTLAEIAKSCKGVSATFAREKLLQGNAFDWQDHYGAISVSPRHLKKVKEYVCNQKQHHAEGSTHDQWEHCEE
jgi:putative transposase